MKTKIQKVLSTCIPWISVFFFVFALVLLGWYLCELYIVKHKLGFGNFCLATIAEISPFFSNILNPIFTVAGTFLVLANLIEFKNNNKKTLEQKKLEFTLNHCEKYFITIQIKYKELAEKGMFSGVLLNKECFDKELKNLIDKNHHVFKEAERVLNGKGIFADIALLIGFFESFAAILLSEQCDLKVAKPIISKTYVDQVLYIQPFISYYRLISGGKENYAQHTLLLWNEWNDKK